MGILPNNCVELNAIFYTTRSVPILKSYRYLDFGSTMILRSTIGSLETTSSTTILGLMICFWSDLLKWSCYYKLLIFISIIFCASPSLLSSAVRYKTPNGNFCYSRVSYPSAIICLSIWSYCLILCCSYINYLWEIVERSVNSCLRSPIKAIISYIISALMI